MREESGERKRPLVQVVDDDPGLRLMIRAVLEQAGFAVTEAGDGPEALFGFPVLRPDIVMLDVLMPQMNGFDVCRALRRLPGGEDTPVLMMTGLDDVDSINCAYEAGATDFVTKPVNLPLVEHRVRYMLRGSQERAELRRGEERYRNLSRQFQTLFDGIRDGLVLLSPGLEVAWVNTALAETARAVAADLVGKKCHDIGMSCSEPCDGCLALKAFTTGEKQEGQVADAAGRTWAVRVFPIVGEGGEVRQVIKQMQDVTEKVRLQAETLRASHLASLGELAAGVAHEINNPVNGIINYAQMLSNRAAEGSREREIAERTLREGNRIAVIVRNLLSFARQHKEVRHPVTIPAVLTDVLALAETQLTRDGICLEVEMPEDLPPVLAIPHHLQQVFLNLISNARYALNEKYPAYDREKALLVRACVAEGAGGRRVRTVFEDRGAGIPARLLQKVLNPFFTTKPADKGTGLGLSISLGIIRDHGGTLAIESVEGEFTRVTIDLPMPPRPAAAHGEVQCPNAS